MMALYRPDAPPPGDPAQSVAAVHDFLRRCAQWAREVEIPKRLDRVGEGADPAEAAKLHEWVAYLRFTEHTLRELEAGELDHWFTGEGSEDTPKS